MVPSESRVYYGDLIVAAIGRPAGPGSHRGDTPTRTDTPTRDGRDSARLAESRGIRIGTGGSGRILSGTSKLSLLGCDA